MEWLALEAVVSSVLLTGARRGPCMPGNPSFLTLEYWHLAQLTASEALLVCEAGFRKSSRQRSFA